MEDEDDIENRSYNRGWMKMKNLKMRKKMVF
jgi:hypothetical protein